MILLQLFWEFFKTGLFSVGGGLATLPFLTKMAENHPEWFDLSMLSDMIAVAESTPGPIGINMATYAGFATGGVWGALIATLAIITPSFIIIFLISKGIKKYKENKYVVRVFYALRAAVTGLIAAAGYSVLKLAFYKDGISSFSQIFTALDWRALIVFAVVLAATQIKQLKKIHPILYIVAGAAAGIVFML